MHCTDDGRQRSDTRTTARWFEFGTFGWQRVSSRCDGRQKNEMGKLPVVSETVELDGMAVSVRGFLFRIVSFVMDCSAECCDSAAY